MSLSPRTRKRTPTGPFINRAPKKSKTPTLKEIKNEGEDEPEKMDLLETRKFPPDKPLDKEELANTLHLKRMTIDKLNLDPFMISKISRQLLTAKKLWSKFSISYRRKEEERKRLIRREKKRKIRAFILNRKPKKDIKKIENTETVEQVESDPETEPEPEVEVSASSEEAPTRKSHKSVPKLNLSLINSEPPDHTQEEESEPREEKIYAQSSRVKSILKYRTLEDRLNHVINPQVLTHRPSRSRPANELGGGDYIFTDRAARSRVKRNQRPMSRMSTFRRRKLEKKRFNRYRNHPEDYSLPKSEDLSKEEKIVRDAIIENLMETSKQKVGWLFSP